MLQRLAEQVAECHRRTRDARERAVKAVDATAKQDNANLERRWLLLARSYEFSQRITDFNVETRRRIATLRPPTPPDPALPRVNCPGCGKKMRLIRIEPRYGDRGERSSFVCTCGEALTLTTKDAS